MIVDTMIAAACAKDVDGFFDHVSKSRMKETTAEQVRKTKPDMSDTLVEMGFSSAMTDWEKDIATWPRALQCSRSTGPSASTSRRSRLT